MELAVAHLPPMTLAADRVEKTKGGLSTRIANAEFAAGSFVRMLDETNSLIAVGVYDETENAVKPRVVLV